MKFISILCAFFILIFTLPSSAAEKDLEEIPYCQYCGMDRQQFRQTRMLIEYEEGSRIGVCSIHDAAVDLAQSARKSIRKILVSDYPTDRLIDAEKAVWVIGSDLAGVMSKKSRLAFFDRAAAASFQKEHGGDIVTFDAAIDDTFDEMWSDLKMIREKRSKMKKMRGR